MILFISSCPILFLKDLPAQNRTDRHERLKEIGKEIRAFEDQIEASKKKESSELYRLANLDLEIDLTQSTIQKLKSDQKKRERQVAKIEKKLSTTEQELKKLKELFAKRLIYIYKYGRLKDVELLLTARSVNDGLLWLEYQKRLSEHDYRNYLKINAKQTQIERNKDLLTVELQQKKKLLKDKLREDDKLKRNKNERQKVLKSIRKDTELLRQQLAEREKSAAEIQNLITQLERAPKERPLPRPGTLFADMKGRMIWPTVGKIITKFGRYKHPELKTITENIGIEIKAPLGKPVRVVASGKVTTITWQRGRGNIIIVSHYGGFYTVYTHLEEIYVNSGEEIEIGDTLGTVGESGSISGPILHFEIWQGTEKLNPEHWLAKST